MFSVLMVALNEPLLPMVAGVVTPLITMLTVSPLGGKDVPEAIVPDNVIEAVPNVIDCEAGTVNVGVSFVMVSCCAVEAVPAEAVIVTVPALVLSKKKLGESWPASKPGPIVLVKICVVQLESLYNLPAPDKLIVVF